MRSKLRFITSLVIANVLLFVNLTMPVFAEVKLPTGRDEEFSQNDIVFYNPDGNSRCNYNPSNDGSSRDTAGGNSSERLKETVRKYGEFAMDLQRKYGSPWEVVFAQMVKESGVGTCTDCVASHVADNGYYNWLGITGDGGSFGVGTPYISSKGRHWAQFATIEKMMEGWAGPLVLRNGYYNDAFQELNPNSYNLHAFLVKMISHYAPSSDGNDESGYVASVEATIRSGIEEVRQEMGWPTSEELAKSENIPVGGSEGMATGGGGGGSTGNGKTLYDECPNTDGGSGNIQEYILGYAWPQYHDPPYLDMTPKYEAAVNKRQSEGKYVGGESYPGRDCGGFVTTLMQESGYDPNYNSDKCGTDCQENYVKREGWELVTDTSKLQPGDVAFDVSGGHTWVYAGEIAGFDSVVASASLDTRAPMAGHEGVDGARWYHRSGGSATGGSANPGEAAGVQFSDRWNWLFPDGIPNSESEMSKYLASVEVPILDENGTRTTMTLRVHSKLTEEYKAIFEDLVSAGFRIKKSATGAYNWRNISGSSKKSTHSYGVAIDVNWNDNPQNKSYYESNKGVNPYTVTDKVISIFRQHGFNWGGYFGSNYDPMHFSYLEKGSLDPN